MGRKRNGNGIWLGLKLVASLRVPERNCLTLATVNVHGHSAMSLSVNPASDLIRSRHNMALRKCVMID